MKTHQIVKLCVWSLGIFVLCTSPACAQTDLTSTQLGGEQGQTELILSPDAIVEELGKADVVYLGETHDNPEDHKAQLEILQALYQQNRKIAIAMEMFQRPYQSILDQYLAGNITETELIEQTEYKQRWGFPWEYYAPLLRFAKTNKLPVLALNTPTEVTRKVASYGLESLTPEERKYIPPLSEIRTDNVEYRKMIQEIYNQHHQQGHGNSISFERFFTAQVLWDETMADGIAQFMIANPDYQVVVIAGKGHIVYGYGIPSRVTRRLNNSNLVQRSVLFGVAEEVQPEGEKGIADFFWHHR
ncbi:MAG TPA: hypothetical protein DCL61_02405 [Cyanobacteria bacterium UBA12227]|nr:hypothetical protein [Cyanobacteria bacterium UBA12227]HAX85536.1 hypothetical protein [Cyanobacteria bacterium UBA11370]HBY75849.1 hypothetical protein [Cyanobacteria bacterium UBA11148]